MTAVAYCRIDTDKKDKAERSFAKKTKRILKYCMQKGITVIDVVNDQCSGTLNRRPGLDSIRDRISTGSLAINFICISSFSALTRSSSQATDLIKEFALNEVNFLPVDEN